MFHWRDIIQKLCIINTHDIKTHVSYLNGFIIWNTWNITFFVSIIEHNHTENMYRVVITLRLIWYKYDTHWNNLSDMVPGRIHFSFSTFRIAYGFRWRLDVKKQKKNYMYINQMGPNIYVTIVKHINAFCITQCVCYTNCVHQKKTEVLISKLVSFVSGRIVGCKFACIRLYHAVFQFYFLNDTNMLVSNCISHWCVSFCSELVQIRLF